jgi:hypothetical protein
VIKLQCENCLVGTICELFRSYNNLLTTIIPFVDMYALVIWRLYMLAMQCLQIQGYFICKYFGDIMQYIYGGICFIYILNILIILSNNYWIKLGCVYMSHLHIEMCFEMILIQVLCQQIFCRQIFLMLRGCPLGE